MLNLSCKVNQFSLTITIVCQYFSMIPLTSLLSFGAYYLAISEIMSRFADGNN